MENSLIAGFIGLAITTSLTCNEPVEVEIIEPLDLYYSSLSVCDCYKSAISVLTNLIDYRDDAYKMLFLELRMNCLTKYGTQLFIPSYCNIPDSIGILMDSLYTLGIDVNT